MWRAILPCEVHLVRPNVSSLSRSCPTRQLLNGTLDHLQLLQYVCNNFGTSWASFQGCFTRSWLRGCARGVQLLRLVQHFSQVCYYLFESRFATWLWNQTASSLHLCILPTWSRMPFPISLHESCRSLHSCVMFYCSGACQLISWILLNSDCYSTGFAIFPLLLQHTTYKHKFYTPCKYTYAILGITFIGCG